MFLSGPRIFVEFVELMIFKFEELPADFRYEFYPAARVVNLLISFTLFETGIGLLAYARLPI
jgi:hypothetical protein